MFLSSVSHPSKLIKPKEGRWNLQAIANWPEIQVTTCTCDWHEGGGGSLEGLNP